MNRIHSNKRGKRAGSSLFWVAVCTLLLVIVVRDSCTAEKGRPCVRLVSEVRFSDVVKQPAPGIVDGGKGLLFELSATKVKEMPGPEIGKRRLSAVEGGQVRKVLPESFYISSSCVEKDGVTYWLLDEYTGGMHCCNRYHFFSKVEPGGPIRYIGSTEGTMNPSDDPWVCKGRNLYFEDFDIRFVYFHTDYASSRLYMPRFYHVTPSSLAVNNRPFKDLYRDEISEVNFQINEIIGLNRPTAYSVLSRDERRSFSDDLGQLLVQKTILHLFARENRKAWATFLKRVRCHYKSTEGVVLLKGEIEELLKDGAY